MSAPFGVTFTNAVRLEYLFERSISIRDAHGYKLIRTDKGGPEHLFDLSVDPFEQDDLLLGGPLAPGSAEEQAYLELRDAIEALYQSELP